MGDQGRSEATLQALTPSDYALVMAKSRDNRLAFATWLIFFRDNGRFPRGPSDLESLDIAALARQIELPVPADAGLPLAERTAKRLRTEIRARFGFREATVVDGETLTAWLRDHVAAEAGGQVEPLIERRLESPAYAHLIDIRWHIRSSMALQWQWKLEIRVSGNWPMISNMNWRKSRKAHGMPPQQFARWSIFSRAIPRCDRIFAYPGLAPYPPGPAAGSPARTGRTARR